MRFRAISRSYHRHSREQMDIDSATNGLLIEQLPKPCKLRTISVRSDFGSAKSEANNIAVAALVARRREIEGEKWMSSVQIRDVRKSFGNFEVLHGVSIPIDDGEF